MREANSLLGGKFHASAVRVEVMTEIIKECHIMKIMWWW